MQTASQSGLTHRPEGGIILNTMSNVFERYTEEQVRIILEGVKNDVDYKDIAREAGITGGKPRIGEFLKYRMVQEFAKAKEQRAVQSGQ